MKTKTVMKPLLDYDETYPDFRDTAAFKSFCSDVAKFIERNDTATYRQLNEAFGRDRRIGEAVENLLRCGEIRECGRSVQVSVFCIGGAQIKPDAPKTLEASRAELGRNFLPKRGAAYMNF